MIGIRALLMMSLGGILRNQTNEILELIRRTSSSLPKVVEDRLERIDYYSLR